MIAFGIDVHYVCPRCKSTLLIDKNNRKIYCKRCDKVSEFPMFDAIKVNLPLIHLENIVCDMSEFSRYKL